MGGRPKGRPAQGREKPKGPVVDVRGEGTGPLGGGRRRGRAAALSGAVCAVVLLAATACSGSAGGSGDAKAGERVTSSPTASQARVTVAPKDGADGVATTGALEVRSTHGRLTSVKVTDPHGGAVAGRISGGGATWTPKGHLATRTRYAVAAVAKDAAGRTTTRHSSFTTLAPHHTFLGTYTPDNGQTVGVGMPVSLHFDRGITDPKAVEAGVRVSTDPAVPVESHWFGNDRLDFRPEHYWAPGTKVTVRLDLDGVQGRPGVYGTQAKQVSFTVGRSQISQVNAATHEMKVVRDGKTIRTVPITAGGPGHDTWNGKMVISEKDRFTHMNSETVGLGHSYDIADVPHAMRLTQSGTFIHGNYWAAPGTFGAYNASHGCVGLRDVRGGGTTTPAAWFYDHSLIGDVVEVSHSHDATVAPDNGLNDWNMSWASWKAPQ